MTNRVVHAGKFLKSQLSNACKRSKHDIYIVTDRIRRMGEGNVFSLFTPGAEGIPRPGPTGGPGLMGGTPARFDGVPQPGLTGEVPQPGLMGGTLARFDGLPQPGLKGEVPQPGLMGSTLARSNGVPQPGLTGDTPARGYPQQGWGTPSQVRTGYSSQGYPLVGVGYPNWQGWGTPARSRWWGYPSQV